MDSTTALSTPRLGPWTSALAVRPWRRHCKCRGSIERVADWTYRLTWWVSDMSGSLAEFCIPTERGYGASNSNRPRWWHPPWGRSRPNTTATKAVNYWRAQRSLHPSPPPSRSVVRVTTSRTFNQHDLGASAQPAEPEMVCRIEFDIDAGCRLTVSNAPDQSTFASIPQLMSSM